MKYIWNVTHMDATYAYNPCDTYGCNTTYGRHICMQHLATLVTHMDATPRMDATYACSTWQHLSHMKSRDIRSEDIRLQNIRSQNIRSQDFALRPRHLVIECLRHAAHAHLATLHDKTQDYTTSHDITRHHKTSHDSYLTLQDRRLQDNSTFCNRSYCLVISLSCNRISSVTSCNLLSCNPISLCLVIEYPSVV